MLQQQERSVEERRDVFARYWLQADRTEALRQTPAGRQLTRDMEQQALRQVPFQERADALLRQANERAEGEGINLNFGQQARDR
jgi:hypothetical protein